jgi:glycosyltransferase 2 family protein
MPLPPRLKRHLITAIRGILGIALAFFLIRFVLRQNQVDLLSELRQATWPWLVVALVLYGLGIVFGIYRWGSLLRVQGVTASTGQLARLTLIGIFFSMALPGGAIGGDVVKMVYVARHAPTRRTEAILSIMLDRLLGLVGLMTVALISVLLCLDWLKVAEPRLQLTVVLVGGACVGGLGALIAISQHRRLLALPGVRGLVNWAGTRLPQAVTQICQRIATGIDLYRNTPRTLIAALGLSLMIHSSVALSVYSLGRAYHEDHAEVRHYFMATQIANAIAAIPAAPGGLGLRDITLAPMLKTAGALPEKAGVVAATLSLIITFWSLLGGVVFILSRGDAEERAAISAAMEGDPSAKP